jgi:hypothetical protein
MLYMNVVTWDPDKRDEVIKRYGEIGQQVPEGMKVLGEWVTLQGDRVFRLVDITTPDPGCSVKANFAWNDLTKLEAFSVMEPAQLLKLVQGA